ncbi:hypothetical protein [Cohaesibacter haloalkalitolerans]|uniref:hypothetical protein n=1 Tax=Cohaesibacter haloalkalitolerans TaxID=1162980 RepID=UPI0013C4D043|nr:hypothetical protein [Cohaesibacter haloalkalitolerans]
MATNSKVIESVRDAIMGMTTGGAALSGWSAGQAVLIGAKTEEAATARIAQGGELNSALDASIPEAEMIVVMDVFCKALDETKDAMAAFNRVAAIKIEATEGVSGALEASSIAAVEFRDALEAGMSPQAALLSAFLSAGAVIRTMSAKKH